MVPEKPAWWHEEASNLQLTPLPDRVFVVLPVSTMYSTREVSEQKAMAQGSAVIAVTEIVRRHLGAQHSHAWIGTTSHETSHQTRTLRHARYADL